MSCFILKSSIIFVFIIFVKEVHGYLYPICSRNEIGCEGEVLNDSHGNSEQNFLSAVAVALNCVLCSSFSFIKSFCNDLLPKSNIISTAGRSYKYKPPPSLFENLAIWTGAKKEDNSDDEIWESQKIFMLASAVIFSMLFLYYGQNWFSTCKDIPELKTYKICHFCRKYLRSSQVSPAASFATCTCEPDEDWNPFQGDI